MEIEGSGGTGKGLELVIHTHPQLYVCAMKNRKEMKRHGMLLLMQIKAVHFLFTTYFNLFKMIQALIVTQIRRFFSTFTVESLIDIIS